MWGTDYSLLNVEDICAFAQCADLEDVREILERQISYNTAISEEGFQGDYGANIGSVLLKSYGDSVKKPRKGPGSRRVRCQDEWLRAASGDQLRQRQPGDDSFPSRTGVCKRAGQQPGGHSARSDYL